MGFLKFFLDSLIASFSYYVGSVDQTPMEQRMSNFFLPGLLICMVGFGLYEWRKYKKTDGQGMGSLLIPALITVGVFFVYEWSVYLLAF